MSWFRRRAERFLFADTSERCPQPGEVTAFAGRRYLVTRVDGHAPVWSDIATGESRVVAYWRNVYGRPVRK